MMMIVMIILIINNSMNLCLIISTLQESRAGNVSQTPGPILCIYIYIITIIVSLLLLYHYIYIYIYCEGGLAAGREARELRRAAARGRGGRGANMGVRSARTYVCIYYMYYM